MLALLDYNRNLCDTMAGNLVNRWRRLGNSESALQKIRDHLVNKELSELAAGRAASDITRKFLPIARSEAGSQTGASLERLADLVQRLCDTVAWPDATRDEFQASVRKLLDGIEIEQEELGELLVVTEDRLQAALDPYLTPIQLAGVEAQNEYLDYLESIKPKARGPTLAELMVVWHQRYTAASAPTKAALGKFLQARNAKDHRAMALACKEVLGAVIPMLREPKNFQLPVRLVPASRGIGKQKLLPLEGAYQQIRDLAIDCSAGRSREVEEHLLQMQTELQTVAAYLADYSLTP